MKILNWFIALKKFELPLPFSSWNEYYISLHEVSENNVDDDYNNKAKYNSTVTKREWDWEREKDTRNEKKRH